MAGQYQGTRLVCGLEEAFLKHSQTRISLRLLRMRRLLRGHSSMPCKVVSRRRGSCNFWRLTEPPFTLRDRDKEG